mgnify:CR=1 FL=1
MGLRKEIEELRRPRNPPVSYQIGRPERERQICWQLDNEDSNDIIDDVLALLDQWELVAEYENGEVAFVRLWLKSDGPQDITQDICVEDAGCVYIYQKEAQSEREG